MMRLKQLVNKKLSWTDVPSFKLYQPYRSEYGVAVRGHLFKGVSIEREKPSNRVYHNFLEMIKRYVLSGWSDQRIILKVYLKSELIRQEETITGKHGYFEFQLKTTQPLDSIEVSISSGLTKRKSSILDLSRPEHILISDIDDTILVSHATKPLKKLWLLLTRSPEQRIEFEGMSAAYRKEDSRKTAIFYISSSEWNLYDFIQSFLVSREFPVSILYLSDIIFWKRLWQSGNKGHNHKIEKIQELISHYPTRRFTLVGDSGQKDPQIYLHICRQFAQRIEKVRIRNIRKTKFKQTKKVISEMKSMGIDAQFFTDSPQLD